MMNYQDTNQSQQEYANNDDFTCNNGRHKKLLLLPHAQSKVSDNLSCIKILVNYIFNIFVNFFAGTHPPRQSSGPHRRPLGTWAEDPCPINLQNSRGILSLGYPRPRDSAGDAR